MCKTNPSNINVVSNPPPDLSETHAKRAIGVILESDVSDNAKVVYLQLAVLLDAGIERPTIRMMADMSRQSPRNVSRRLRELRKDGLIRCEYNRAEGEASDYFLIAPLSPDADHAIRDDKKKTTPKK